MHIGAGMLRLQRMSGMTKWDVFETRCIWMYHQ